MPSRKELIKQIEASCKSKVVCYLTSDRGQLGTQIGEDVLPILYQHLSGIGKVNRISLLIYSRGGHTLTGFAISNALREFAKEIDVLIPFRAHSCATLISLSANRILMGPFGQLSPIDPSIQTPHGPTMQVNGQTQFIPVSVEDVANFLELARKEAKVPADKMNEVLSHLCSKINPLALGAVYRAREQIGMLAKKLLKLHKKDDQEIERIVNALTRELLSHDYFIGRGEAKSLGLQIEDPSDDLAGQMWDLYREFAEEMKLGEGWNPELELGSGSTKKAVTCRGVVESYDKRHSYYTTFELKRTNLMKDGVKYEAVQTKVIEDGWTNA
jgi:hypothetical protein